MIIPEIIIQRVLVNGIRRIRNIPWKSDQLFKSVPQSFSRQFYELIQNTPIDITINYPREDSQFPCIAILLNAEEESDIFLGDLLSAGYDSSDSLIGSEGLFYTDGETSSSLDATYGLADALGQGQKYGDTPRIFDKSVQTYKERRGSGYSCSYLLQVMTDDQDFTIFLYHLIRFILMAGIPTFTTNGIHQIRFSGTDFLPQAAQQPTFIFMRGINMSFLYFADYYLQEGDEDLESVAKAFVINMADAWGNSPDTLAQVQKPNITAVSVVTAAIGSTTTGISVSGINFQKGLTIEFIKSDDPTTFLRKSFLTSSVLANSSTLQVEDVSVFGAAPFLIQVGGGDKTEQVRIISTDTVLKTLTIDDTASSPFNQTTYAHPALTRISSYNGTSVSNINLGSTEFKIEFNPITAGNTASTTKIFNCGIGDVVPTSLSQGMFLEVIGPKSHGAWGEKRRIISFTSGSGGTITVATDFSSNLAGTTVQVIKESSVDVVTSVDGDPVTRKFTFNLTISTDTTKGVWDIKVINPDLISTTLSNSFTIT